MRILAISQGLSIERRGYWSRLSVRFGFLSGGGGGRYWVWALAPRTLVVGLVEATVGNFLGFLKFLHQYFLHYQNSFAGT